MTRLEDRQILVRDIETNNERNRGIYVLKSRGMNHSTQVREFLITDDGIVLLPIYLTPEGILTGSAKLEHTLKAQEEDKLRENKIKNEKREIARKRKIMEENIAVLREKFESDIESLIQTKVENNLKEESKKRDKTEIIDLRNKNRGSTEKLKIRNN